MSGDSSEEKTEKPSAKKLRDARKRGEVAKSAELAASASMLAGLVTVITLIDSMSKRLADLFLAVERSFERLEKEVLLNVVQEALYLVGWLSLPPLGVAAAVGLIALWLQTGTVLSLDPVIPKLERINPASGLKNLVSMKTLVQFLMMASKSLVIGVAVVIIGLRLMPDAIRVIHADIGAALEVVQYGLMQLMLWCGSLFLLLGFADLGFQRWQYLRDQRMSKTELKRETKEQQGDGTQKAERKRVAQEPPQEELLKYLRFASLVVRHDDGRLIVFINRPEASPLPIYLLRATGAFALTVKAAAERNRTPQVRDDALLEALYHQVVTASPMRASMAPDVMAHIAKQEAAAR
jgi:type III secretory pathway component EscU